MSSITILRNFSKVASLRGYARCFKANTDLCTGVSSPVLRMASSLSAAETSACVAPRDVATKDYIFQQTMLRVKDPKKSLKFYSEVLGMRLLHRLDFPSMKFSLFFMGYEAEEDFPTTEEERLAWCFSRKATLELTHNWGSESDPDITYHNGNSDPRGFGHIGIAVPDLHEACKRFDELKVDFKKRPEDGSMNGIAFIIDPDGYWIEIFNPKKVLVTNEMKNEE